MFSKLLFASFDANHNFVEEMIGNILDGFDIEPEVSCWLKKINDVVCFPSLGTFYLGCLK